MSVNLSWERIKLLREAMWDAPREKRGMYLAAIAEIIEAAIVAGKRREGIAHMLRRTRFSHSEVSLLREWAIENNHLDLDEVLAAVNAEMRA